MTTLGLHPDGGGMDHEHEPDVTVNEERYIRMPAKVLYLFAAALIAATVAYMDIRNEEKETRRIAIEAVATGQANNLALQTMNGDMGKVQQQLKDFAESSQRMYDKYFRDANDPERVLKGR